MPAIVPSHDQPLPDGSQNRNPPGIGFAALVAEDFRRHDRDFFSQGFWALFWHRFGNKRMDFPKPVRMFATVLYRVMYKVCEWVCGIHMPYPVQIGRRLRIEHFGAMMIVPRAIGDDVILRHATTMGIASAGQLTGKPIIGNRVEIGAGAMILGAVTVGNDAVIGANAVVVHDVAPGDTVVGIPARPIRRGVVGGAADGD